LIHSYQAFFLWQKGKKILSASFDKISSSQILGCLLVFFSFSKLLLNDYSTFERLGLVLNDYSTFERFERNRDKKVTYLSFNGQNDKKVI